MANIYNTVSCPNCGEHEFIKKGLNSNKSEICLMCKRCGKRFQVEVNADKTMPLSEEVAMNAPLTIETPTVETKTAYEEVPSEDRICHLYTEDGKIITLPNGIPSTKENIIEFCDKMAFTCIPVDEEEGIYKAQTRRTHSKG